MAARATKAGPKIGRDVTSELEFLTRALKAPTLRESVQRLAERAREESWPRACNARCQRGNPTVARDGSAQPGSLPARAWRTSTTTTPVA